MDLFCYEEIDFDELMVFCHDSPKEIVPFTFFTVFNKDIAYYPAHPVSSGHLTCDHHLRRLYPTSMCIPYDEKCHTAYRFPIYFSRPLLSIQPLERMVLKAFPELSLTSLIPFARVKSLFDYWCPRSVLAVTLEMKVVGKGHIYNPFQLAHVEILYVWIRTLVFCRYYYAYLPPGINQVIPLCLYEHHALCLNTAETCLACQLWESCWEYMLYAQRDFQEGPNLLFKTSKHLYANLFVV